MPNAPDNPSVEALLAQAGWVRALARGLVADRALADDVEQDTWLAALQKPPLAAAGERSVKSWLARVARNAAGQRARSAGARARRERAASRGEPQPGAAAVVEQAWTHRRLVDAVLHLREPERSTVLLRYFHGRSAEEIARATGVPGSTVRDRLRRALEELRAELGRELGGEEAWLRALAPLAGPLGDTGPSIVGVMAMGNAVKVAGAAALAVALGALFGCATRT